MGFSLTSNLCTLPLLGKQLHGTAQRLGANESSFVYEVDFFHVQQNVKKLLPHCLTESSWGSDQDVPQKAPWTYNMAGVQLIFKRNRRSHQPCPNNHGKLMGVQSHWNLPNGWTLANLEIWNRTLDHMGKIMSIMSQIPLEIHHRGSKPTIL